MPSTAVRQKKTVSVTLEPALLEQAREAGLNLSAILSKALHYEIRTTEAERWKRENSEGLQELNRITEEHGLLSDEYRTF
ncbi:MULTISPECIES: type II toxin-antitoxin system CcdA family antitoxin [Pantoea]|jgi:antitoxin CcdA|uniref:Type II toxin-antitoxin system CcdA family antitoxin n=1 Tax=Pantoea sp. BJ2 TaxID=3141322 RepID=A0AAU7U2J8_9GAMM|nr:MULTISPECIES: type II toxin-antitoxin system CcdA family antitoxin [Pantoea]MBD9660079.1 type II toxin-antitoxin system CcdA family antitoxin [Pantoea sp. PNT03]MBY4952615.1 type II toxin-antitoxin system CcdA family antitoxin [Pantoea sp. DY-17]MDR6352765.1 antitoxin CcdA [Pantoea sp. SORGH_AS_0659]QCP61958.1 antitoxin [Pantoea sp. SO10]WFL69791.1 type II toxin-antitoxin system CcdA family antitoxin [Pantoea sp. X85]